MNRSSSSATSAALLFELVPEDLAPPEPTPPCGTPRVRQAHRQQVEMRCLSLDQLLPEDHPVRVVWQYVQQLDLRPLYEPIRAVEGPAEG